MMSGSASRLESPPEARAPPKGRTNTHSRSAWTVPAGPVPPPKSPRWNPSVYGEYVEATVRFTDEIWKTGESRASRGSVWVSRAPPSCTLLQQSNEFDLPGFQSRVRA
jgi:hypothetical protein